MKTLWYWFRCKMGAPVFEVYDPAGKHHHTGPDAVVLCKGCGRGKAYHL